MKVNLYPSDAYGSGRYRIVYPAQAAKVAGCDAYIATSGRPGEGMAIERTTINGQSYVRPEPIDADVIVLQRCSDETTVAIMQSLQRAGHAVVVDIDDDVSCLPPTHPAHRQMNPRVSPNMNWGIFAHAARIADLVTVTTPALADRYGKHDRVMILPNRIPERVLDMPRDSDGQTVGWTGFTPTHPGDLRVTGGGVNDALRRTGARFLQIGPATGVKEQLALDDYPEATGGLNDIDDYYAAIGRLDVGICPLDDTKFNRAKSWLKPLEMLARGVPVVCSPLPEYETFLDDVGGGLCAGARGREWRRAIEQLLTDPDRESLAGGARDAIRERHTYEARGGEWCDAWEEARANANRRLARSTAAA